MNSLFPRTLVLLTAMPLLVGAGLTPVRAHEVKLPAHSNARLEAPTSVSVYLALEGRSVVEVLRDAAPITREQRVDIARREIASLVAQQRDLQQQVEALGGVVEADFQRLANALQVRIDPERWDRLRSLPGVERVELVPVHERALASAVPFVGADRLWNAAGVAATGDGIRIGIVDTGIDYLHAHFGGSGDPQEYKSNDRTIIEPGSFPTAKVVGGRDFVGDAYTGQNLPVPDPDPLDCSREQESYITGGHGSHVAGIAAGTGVRSDGTPYDGPYEASLSPSLFKIAPGVAPEASLYALKIFGCDGSTAMVAAAMEWAVDPNKDGDFSDRLDVLNMSLGGSYGLQTGTDEKLVRNLTDAGTLVVVAAGNDGNTFFVTGSPATHTDALSVAATTDQTSFLSMRVESPASVAGEVACVEGSFTKPLAEVGELTGVLQATVPAKACSTVTNASELAGKIALIDRGDCYFVDKIQRAAEAGALAAVVVNNQNEAPFSMGGTGTVGEIPGVMVSLSDGTALRNAQNVTVVLDPKNVVSNADDADQMAVFSSRGPRTLDGMLKPDVAAPGVSIDSAGVASGNQPRQNQGTSMACPMVAGAAALLREIHPERAPLDIKAMLMNTTAPLTDGEGNPTPVSLAGAGRIRVDAAARQDVLVASTTTPGAVSVSFGAVVSSEPVTLTREVVVSNLGSTSKSFDLTIASTYDLPGAQVTVSPASLTVPAGQTATATITLSVDPSALPMEEPDPHTPAALSFGADSYPRHFVTEAAGHVVFLEPGAGPDDALRVPFHGIVRAADERTATLTRRCKTGADVPLQISVDGLTTHKEPLTTAFELAATHPQDMLPAPNERIADLIALGVATNTATAESFEDASVYFALVVSGEWMTPAMGPLSLVGVSLDTNLDGSEDYAVFAEPLDRMFHADVLAANTYDLRTGQSVSRRFLNLFPRDQLNTEPFNNSVVVLPVSLERLKLDPENATFRFRGFTQLSGFFRHNTTEWVDYDPSQPSIDTAVGGKDGSPFHPAPGQVVIHAPPSDAPLPRVLLLHHTNKRGMRHEIVDLALMMDTEPTDLVMDQQVPGAMKTGQTASVVWTVSNAGEFTAYDVTARGGVKGSASIGTVEASQGTCEVGTDVRCSLGDLEPGATATVTFDLIAGPTTMLVEGQVQDGLSCETSLSNNQVTGSIAIESGGLVPIEEDEEDPALFIEDFDAGGGCSCGVPASAVSRNFFFGLVGLSWLGIWLRRRRS